MLQSDIDTFVYLSFILSMYKDWHVTNNLDR